jgi:5'-3' exoribonuclease 2
LISSLKYKTDLAHVGYLTSGAGDVDFTRAKRMLSRIGTKEDEVFQERKVKEEQSLARDVEQRKRVAEAKERQKQQQAAAKQTRSLLPEKRKPLQPASVSSAPTDASKGLASAPVSPPIPPIETLMELGDKNKRLRVGDGSANKAAAEKFKRKLTALKQGKATANVGASGGSKTGLSVAELGIAKRVPGGSSTKAALPVEKSGRDQSVASSSAVKPSESSNAVSENASAGADWPEDEAVPAAVEERTLKEFEKELKERLDAQGVIENPTDNVRLGDEGWKDRYYLHKFNWGPEDGERKERLFHVYLEGLYWVMKYYYVGCISWNWYYPYHYAPFASDIVSSRTTSENIKLEMGNPFRPFTQLQAVMPASSGVLVLPKCYSRLMTDPDSPIIDYYPDEFEIDLNGKRFAWQGVALLPFIDEKRLNEALEGLDSQLTDVEKARNSFGDCLVVAHTDSSLGRAVVALAGENPDGELEIAPALAEGQLFGKVSPRGTLGPGDAVVAARFELPPFKAHQTSLLPGAQPPPEVLDDFTKAECAQRGGWKPARFGSLGRAARELAENRDYRLGGGRGRSSRGRGRGGGRGGASNGRGGAMPAGSYYQSNAPVINPPVHPSAAAMFGGLGLGGGAMPGIAGPGQPAWMAQNAAMYQAQPQIGYQDQQHQYMYGANAAYGAQGGYNAQYGGQAYLAPTYPGGGYQSGYAPQYGGAAAGGYAPGAAQQQYNFSANPAFYTQQQHAGGVPSTAPTGGGLAGPTAMQMRQASHPQPVRSRPQWSQFSQPAANQGRGRARGGRGGRGRSS